MFGCTTEEAVGTNVGRFVPKGLPPEDGKQIRLVGKGDVTSRPSGAVESLWALRSNGQAFPIEASLSQTETDGNKLLTVIIRDVTERRRAEQILRESEERFRLVANTAPVMIWISGTDKLCSYFNQPWLEFTGRPLELELGNGWADGVHKEDLDTCFKTYSESFDRRETFRMEYRLRRCDGEYRWVSDMGVPRFDPDGSFAGYIGSCIDVTEQKLAGEALATIGRRLIEAHEEERTWIGRELHDDINQRLALLAVELDNWNQEPPSKGEFHKYVETAKQRITDLGKDVQALSHRLHSSKLDYLGLASAAGSFCRELAEQRKVEIDFHQSGVPRNLPKEISLSLFRVLQESLQNAVKHSGVGHFSVELRGTPSEIQLVVNDSGAGFDQQDMLTRRGLGLISMRERLQMVSGEFSVKSEPGRGTTIWARVPLEREAQRASMAG
jgi:PAS domain S-box-containing protein